MAATFTPSASYSRIGSRRTFGIELETHRCPDMRTLGGPRQYPFSSKTDGSIEGLEFVSQILSSDKGLTEIERFLAAIPGSWKVNRKCGFHLHVGTDDLTDQQLCTVARSYLHCQQLWQSFVPPTRRTNRYCKEISWTIQNLRYIHGGLANFRSWAGSLDRYQWFNCAAYAKRGGQRGFCGTMEIRIHPGTLDARKVVNWTRAHCRFIDYAAGLSFDEVPTALGQTCQEQFSKLCVIWHDRALSRHFHTRASRWGLPDLQNA
jgi:hypothetical protein